MSVLRSDPYSRAPGRARGAMRGVTGGATLFALMFLSLALMVMSRLNHTWVQDARGKAIETLLPVLETVSVPAVRFQQLRRKVGAYVKVLSEIDRLEEQNEQLRRWESRARVLEQEITKYRTLLNARDTRKFAFVTGRVVADGRGPFARSVILNIGRNEKIRDGYPVVNGEGLVGRTLNAGARASRVLLLSDPNSRVPVLFGSGGTRGVLAGDNSVQPELVFIPQSAQPSIGDVVRTSGHGGLFPPGLSIGTISAVTPKIRVRLHADADRINFVSVLLFPQPAIEDLGSLAANVRRPGRRKFAGPGFGKYMILPTRPRGTLKNDALQRRTIKARRTR